MKKILTPLALIFAASVFAETEYTVIIDEDTSLASLSGNTRVTNNATLTLTSQNPRNYSLLIDAGAAVSSNDLLKWGTSGGPKQNEIDIYGSFYMNGKEFRMGDDGASWSTTVNVYSGGVFANDANDSGTFTISNFRGENSIVNVYAGGLVKNFNISSFGRNSEQAATPTFEFNVNGGAASAASITLGNSAQDEKIQYSSINVTNGGTMTASGGITLGAAARNDSRINVLGAGSTFTANANVALNNTSAISVSDGGAFVSASNVYINNGEITIGDGGAWNVNTAPGQAFVVGNNASGTARFTIDGGAMNMNATNNDMNLYICNSAGSQGFFTITNGGTYQQGEGAKNSQVFLGNGTGVLEISNGGKWLANTNFYIGNASSANAALILDNGKITGRTGSGYSSDLNIASAASAVGRVEVSNGGSADMRTFRMSQGGVNSASTLIIRDAGSYVKANNTNDNNYLFELGVNADSAKYSGNAANIFIYTGAQLWNASVGTAWLRDSAQMNFMLDSDNVDAADTAMFRTGKLAVYKSDGASTPFVIDGANLSSNGDLSQGDVVGFTILTATGDKSYNGALLDFTDATTLSQIFEFKNNVSLADWEDFNANNLAWDGSNLILSLTYVPEPSTCAAIFGALALAFAAYRRRK